MKQRWRKGLGRKEVEKINKNEGRGMVTKKRSRERKKGKKSYEKKRKKIIKEVEEG